MSILSINNIITQLDTPSSLLPFFVKDTFDVTGRTVMAKKEGGKHEAREKFIEEAGTSAFWIGGIPLFRYIGNKLFKNKIDSEIDFKRINTDGVQSYFAKESKKFDSKDLKGINLESSKLTEIQKKLSDEKYVVNGSKGFYKKYHIGLTAASVLINLGILTVALPKLNQYLSRKIIAKEMQEKANKIEVNQTSMDEKQPQIQQPETESKKDKQPSFKGLSKIKDVFKEMVNFTQMAENAQLNVQNSMLILDFGISTSRVTIVPRDNNERIENAVKEGGIIVFFYYAGDIIKKGISKIADKIFKTPIELDYKVLANKEFLKSLKHPEKREDLLKFVELEKDDKNAELKVIKLIDEELAKITTDPKNTKDEHFFAENFTLKSAYEDGLIKVEHDGKKWIRHSKKYIQTDKIIELNENLNKFYDATVENLQKNNITLEKIISKTKAVKIASVIANIGICCASLSYFLPKIQYMIREHRTDTKRAPGIKLYEEMAEKNELKV